MIDMYAKFYVGRPHGKPMNMIAIRMNILLNNFKYLDLATYYSKQLNCAFVFK